MDATNTPLASTATVIPGSQAALQSYDADAWSGSGLRRAARDPCPVPPVLRVPADVPLRAAKDDWEPPALAQSKEVADVADGASDDTAASRCFARVRLRVSRLRRRRAASSAASSKVLGTYPWLSVSLYLRHVAIMCVS